MQNIEEKSRENYGSGIVWTVMGVMRVMDRLVCTVMGVI